ncbi:hypothetical protein FRC17_005593 [Serendipita sp. 399]|nr:hypothetical protein FRC17_005593 [Serendipita sp. 399]
MDVIVPDWLIRAYNIFGRPLITGHGFTVQNGPAKGATDENPSKHRYTDGNSLLCFEALISPILRSALLLPVHDYPEARAGPSGYHMWTSYPNAFDFLRFQEKFEIAKYENPDLTLQTVAPDLIPGWQYWDVELLALAQKDYEKWKRRFI